LGAIAKKDAQAIACKVDDLVSAAISGSGPSPALAEWLAKIGDDLHNKPAEQELCKPRSNFTLEQWLTRYMAEHSPRVGEYCRRNLELGKGYLLEYFKAGQSLRAISSEDAQAYRVWLAGSKGYAQATVAQHIKKAKQFFLAAVEAGVIDKSPFAKVLAGTMVNAERSFYVPASDIEKAIAMAPDAQWRLIIALSRYAGLRSPSEVLALRWADVDFTAGTLTVFATKTAKHGKTKRVVPILPELRPHLEDAFDPESERCISRYQTSNLNLRKVFLEILAKAELKPWPRLFHNLRGSLQTDLADRFPSHVVTEWLGNSERVANDHYLKVTHTHLLNATQGVGQQVGHSLAESTPKQGKSLPENPAKTEVLAKTQRGVVDISTPARTRTFDPVIKSHLLYQLSYEGTFVRSDSKESALRPKDDRNPLSECGIVASNGSLARATFLGKLPGD
jgi:integrase